MSIKKEIERRRLNMESEVYRSMDELGIQTLLHHSGIQKQKSYSTVTLLFALIVLPVIRRCLSALWSGKFFENPVQAHKDTYYQFLNHPWFNWRKLITLLACREITRTDQPPFSEEVIIADDTLLHKTNENMELVSYYHDHGTKRSQLDSQMLRVGSRKGR
jgi:hypothetical protein